MNSTNNLDVKVKRFFSKLALTALLSGSTLASCKQVESYKPIEENYNLPPGTQRITIHSSTTQDGYNPGYDSHLIHIITEPNGAAISVNKEYIGDSPIHVFIKRGYSYYDSNLNFTNTWKTHRSLESINIAATPKGDNATNLYEQSASFSRDDINLPKKIFLDLRSNRSKPDAIFEHRQR